MNTGSNFFEILGIALAITSVLCIVFAIIIVFISFMNDMFVDGDIIKYSYLRLDYIGSLSFLALISGIISYLFMKVKKIKV